MSVNRSPGAMIGERGEGGSARGAITEDMHQAILHLPDGVWEPAYDPGGQVRPRAWVAEITGLLDLSLWPKGMRVIVRKERPHPGAQPSLGRLPKTHSSCPAASAARC